MEQKKFIKIMVVVAVILVVLLALVMCGWQFLTISNGKIILKTAKTQPATTGTQPATTGTQPATTGTQPATTGTQPDNNLPVVKTPDLPTLFYPIYIKGSIGMALGNVVPRIQPPFSGNPQITYSITPAVSPGLVFDTTTGIISGTPTELPLYYTTEYTNSRDNSVSATQTFYTVTATYPTGVITAKLNIFISNPSVPVPSFAELILMVITDTRALKIIAQAADVINKEINSPLQEF